jgi:hypothetical protein
MVCRASPDSIERTIFVSKGINMKLRFTNVRGLSFAGCIFLLAATVSGISQTSASTDAITPLAQTLAANEKIFIEAKRKDDKSYFKRILSEDFTLVGVDGTLHQKQEAVDELGDSALLELSPYNIKAVRITDDAAVISYDAVVREAPQEDQGPPPRYQHFSSVWVKQGDQWKLKFHQATAAHWGDW